ncbi:NAD-dependent epimerase/dehydratase family protein [Luedemannella flava]
MTRVLVFGVTGFLGRHVAAAFAGRPGTEVVTAGRRPGPGGVDHQVDLATAGPAAMADLVRAVAPDAVVNCAGVTGTDPVELVSGNVVAVATVLSALHRTGFGGRFVHLGSAAEYGITPPGVAVTERTPTAPTSPYGVTKLAGTALALAARDELDVTVLRVFNPIGPGASENQLAGRLVAQLRRARATGEPATVGALDGHRDLIDARDVATAVVAAATTGTGCRAYSTWVRAGPPRCGSWPRRPPTRRAARPCARRAPGRRTRRRSPGSGPTSR